MNGVTLVHGGLDIDISRTDDSQPWQGTMTFYRSSDRLLFKTIPTAESRQFIKATHHFTQLCEVNVGGVTWTSGKTINRTDSTSDSPAAVVFNSKLYTFWKANDHSNRIFFSASTDGVTWPAGRTINGTDTASAALAAAVFDNKLYVFWKANDPSNRIFFSASTDGVTWPAGRTINGTDTTSAALAAAVFDNKLYVFWKANDPSNRIFFSASSNGTSWPAGHVINNTDTTPAAPSTAVFNSQLYVFWKSNPHEKISFSASSSGTSWLAGQLIQRCGQHAARRDHRGARRSAVPPVEGRRSERPDLVSARRAAARSGPRVRRSTTPIRPASRWGQRSARSTTAFMCSGRPRILRTGSTQSLSGPVVVIALSSTAGPRSSAALASRNPTTGR